VSTSSAKVKLSIPTTVEVEISPDQFVAFLIASTDWKELEYDQHVARFESTLPLKGSHLRALHRFVSVVMRPDLPGMNDLYGDVGRTLTKLAEAYGLTDLQMYERIAGAVLVGKFSPSNPSPVDIECERCDSMTNTGICAECAHYAECMGCGACRNRVSKE
jgi:hypothetical protein